MVNRKKMAVVLGAMVFVIIGIAASSVPKPTRNLKVLPKDISDETLDKVMDEFSNALGVKCNFCHVQSETDSTQWDMASDVKPEKNVARKMITMSNKINKDFFNGTTKYGDENAVLEVHCVTCHHGTEHPEMEEEDSTNKSKQ